MPARRWRRKGFAQRRRIQAESLEPCRRGRRGRGASVMGNRARTRSMREDGWGLNDRPGSRMAGLIMLPGEG